MGSSANSEVVIWPGEGHQDFAGHDGDRQFGRIMREPAGPTKNKWRWSISHIEGVKRMIMPHNGWELSPRSAAAKVEDLYDRLVELNGLSR